MVTKIITAMRVAIYIRVSTKMQEDKYSLRAQIYELNRYANAQGWIIVDTYKDVDSGTKLNKDGLEAMLDAVEEGQVDVVLCIEQDRLSRLDTIKWEYLKGVLKDNQVKIAEPGNIVDLSNIDDEFMSDLKNLLAQRDRRNMLRKMARGIRQRTREGKVWGPQPEEYNYDRFSEILTVNEDRAWLIPFIDGKYLKEKLNPTAIARELNKRCKTAEGKEWSESQVVDKLIRKAYHGVFERKFKGETISTPNVYPELRTEETYIRIQAEMKKRYNWKPAEPHMLRGIDIKCVSCGNTLTINKTITYGRSPKDKKGYDVFNIMHSSPKLRDECSSNPYVNVRRIQHQLKEAVKGILSDVEKADQYIDSSFDGKELSNLGIEIKHLEKQKQSIQEKTDRLLDLYLDGKWSKDKLDENRMDIDMQLITINDDLSEAIRKRDLILNNQINYDTVLEHLTVADRYEEMLDVQEQQDLLGSLFPSASLDIKQDVFTLHAYLAQEVTVDIKIRIESTDETRNRETLEQARVRYDHAQESLNKHKGMTMKALGLVVDAQPNTLRRDQERFGPFKHLARHWSCPNLRQERVDAIKKELALDPQAHDRKISAATGIYRKMIRRLIEEEGLKSRYS